MKQIICILLLGSALFAGPKIRTGFPEFPLVDQFGQKQKVQRKGTSKVIVSFEKEVSTAINHVLLKQDKAFLTDNNVTYISDISHAPKLIIDWVALPKMKKFPFKIALIYDKNTAEKLDHKKGKITVYSLKDGAIVKIEFIAPRALAKELGKNRGGRSL